VYVVFNAKKAIHIDIYDNVTKITTIHSTIDDGYFDNDSVYLLDHVELTNNYFVFNSRFYLLNPEQILNITFDISDNTYPLYFTKATNTVTINYNNEDDITFHTITNIFDVGESYSLTVPSTYSKSGTDYRL